MASVDDDDRVPDSQDGDGEDSNSDDGQRPIRGLPQRPPPSLDHPDRIKACWSVERGICNTSACGAAIAAVVPGLKAQLPGQSRWNILADSLLNPPLTPGRVLSLSGLHPKDPSLADHVAVYAHVVTVQDRDTGDIKVLPYVGSAMAGMLRRDGPGPLASRMAYYDKVITRAAGWEKTRRDMSEHGLVFRLTDREFKNLSGKEKKEEKWRPYKVIGDTWFVLWSIPREEITQLLVPGLGPPLLKLYRQYQSRDPNLGEMYTLLQAAVWGIEGHYILGYGDAYLGDMPALQELRDKVRDPPIWLEDKGIDVFSLNARFTSFERSIGAPSRPPTAEKKDAYQQTLLFYEDIIKKRIPRSEESIKAYRGRPGQAYDEVTYDNLDQLDGLPDLDLPENEKVVSPRASRLVVDMEFDSDGMGQLQAVSKRDVVLFALGTGKWWPEAITQGFEFNTGYSLADHPHYCKRDPQPWVGDIVIKVPAGTDGWSVDIDLEHLDRNGLPPPTGTGIAINFWTGSHTRPRKILQLRRQYGKLFQGEQSHDRVLSAFAMVLRISIAACKLKDYPLPKCLLERPGSTHLAWNDEDDYSDPAEQIRLDLQADGKLAIAGFQPGQVVAQQAELIAGIPCQVRPLGGPLPRGSVMRGLGRDEEAGLPVALLLDRARSILGASKQVSGMREVLDETWTTHAVLPRTLTYLGYGVSAHRFSVRGQPTIALIKGFEELGNQTAFLERVSNVLDGLQDGYFEVGENDRHCFLQWHDNETWVQVDVTTELVKEDGDVILPPAWSTHRQVEDGSFWPDPSLTVPGLGDRAMEEALVEAIERSDHIAIVGFLAATEVSPVLTEARLARLALVCLQHLVSDISLGVSSADISLGVSSDEPVSIANWLIQYIMESELHSDSDNLPDLSNASILRTLHAVGLYLPGALIVPLDTLDLGPLDSAADLQLLVQMAQDMPWPIVSPLLTEVPDQVRLGRSLAKTTSAYWAVWTLTTGGWLVMTPENLQFPEGHDPETIPLHTVRQVDVHNEGDHLAIDLHVGGGGDGGVEVRLERGLGKQDAIWKLSRWCHRVVEGGDLDPGLPSDVDFDEEVWAETMLTVLARDV
ncbi:hypothetical protein FFLO_03828 [Filobasidium floriforme]|uniref:Uncharacterized protein n=1 Tax=Filobasidium floriforme TaxID=5210 RepID=A0A8K0JLF6_9TREE|nr:uncharacterized protein HD553DRAFT_343287 [Filobasidium floriforme]KAG7532140.1 hypothetical protein FFLO_03828 [Filobasidium floriforme]KAH8083282.1 hypothetical protein HD553DRAFT_343287 [Filobasidium floriforme]